MTAQSQFTVRANGQISRDGKILGMINVQPGTGKRLLKHEGQVHDLTHIFHTDRIGAKLEEIFGA